IVLRREGGTRLAICPYPEDVAHEAALPEGDRVHIRAVRPQDGPRLAALAASLPQSDRRLPFLGEAAEPGGAARLAQIDYDREMTLVAIQVGTDEMLGLARLVADPENDAAEFAILVRAEARGRGIGHALMQALVDHARRRGLARLEGEVPTANVVM